MKKAIFTTISPVRLHGEDFPVGSEIEIDERTAAQLVAAKAIDPASGREVAPDGPSAPTDPAERQAAIVEAIGKLDQHNPEHWLQDGKPDAAALAEILGWPVKAAERNAAWATMAVPQQ